MNRRGRQPTVGELWRQLAERIQRAGKHHQRDHYVLDQQTGIHENNPAT